MNEQEKRRRVGLCVLQVLRTQIRRLQKTGHVCAALYGPSRIEQVALQANVQAVRRKKLTPSFGDVRVHRHERVPLAVKALELEHPQHFLSLRKSLRFVAVNRTQAPLLARGLSHTGVM